MNTPPKTVAEQWLGYKNKVYSKVKMHPQQEVEVWQAFYAGAFIMFNLMMETANLPDADAERALKAIDKEIRDTLDTHVTVHGAPRG